MNKVIMKRLSQWWQRFLKWLRSKLRRPGVMHLLIRILKLIELVLHLINLITGQ